MNTEIKKNPVSAVFSGLLKIVIPGVIVISLISGIDLLFEEADKEKKEFLHLVQEGEVKRTYVNIDKMKEYSKDEILDDDTKENYLIREWEEDTEDPTFFKFKMETINQKGIVEKVEVRASKQMNKKIKKPMYSYYEYQGKHYNPIVHLPLKKNKQG